ncbi:MAG: tetratricopeptide repeat protein [Moorea sp. SIO2B7]|nr:tetratricopeptide repeat protein [Moorena sp. SIO2B7]
MPHPQDIIGGRYQIIQELGRGGFGKTYLAEDMGIPKKPQCVVKQLQPRFNSQVLWDNAKERFATEAIVLQRLGNHDQIPQLFAHLEENQEFYLIQDFIDGEELRKEISREVLDESGVISLLQDVLEILDFVHHQGVIHRDIKPSNLMRRRSDGKMVLIDFGAVKEISTLSIDLQGQNITQMVGTPGYMPEEQIAGKPTFGSDIYALGRTAIYALTGRSPNQLEDSQTGELRSWQELAPVSDKLATILEKMIRPKYSERYHCAIDVLQDLQPLIKIGKTLGGRYRITRYLGGGLWGHTYLAENLLKKYQSTCVIKQLKPQTGAQLSLEEAERRFDNELKVLQKLGNYPQIPELLDHFEETEEFYLVQEFIDGQDLAKELQDNKRLNEETVFALLKDVLEILYFIHTKGVIHRDIKPSNLIRRRSDNKILLIDFGLVKEIVSLSSYGVESRSSTQAVGTEGYMAPEQMSGRPTFSSDIYSLGMTAIQALTGSYPDQFQTNPQTGELIWREGIKTNPKLARILDKMVRLDLQKRYSSADKVLKDLDKAWDNYQPQSKPATQVVPTNPPEPRVSRSSRNWQRKFLNPLYFLGALAGLGVFLGSLKLFQLSLRPWIWEYQCKQLIEKEQSQAALSLSEKMLKLKPNNLKALNCRGDAFSQLKRYEDALAIYERGLKLNPNDLETLNGKGTVLYQLQQIEEARDIFRKIIKIDENNAEAWKGLGDVLYRLEYYQSALASSRKALDLNPNDPETWNRKGRALYKLERYDEALDAQEKALKIKPNYAQALSDKGIALIGLQKNKEALEAFNKAQNIKPLDPRFWQNKALALKYLGQKQESLDIYNAALDAYDQALDANPKNAIAWVDRGYVLIQLQLYKDAITSYDKAIQIKPDFYLAWLGKGNALIPTRDYDGALVAFDKALEIRPESYLTWHNRGSLLVGKRNLSEAIKSYEKAIKINPSFYHAWRDRGFALSQLNRNQDAIISFEKALDIEPKDYKSWVGLGIARMILKQYSEALAALDKAIDIQPNNPLIWMNKGGLLEDWNRLQQACQSYKSAIEIDPRFQPAIKAVARLKCN